MTSQYFFENAGIPFRVTFWKIARIVSDVGAVAAPGAPRGSRSARSILLDRSLLVSRQRPREYIPRLFRAFRDVRRGADDVLAPLIPRPLERSPRSQRVCQGRSERSHLPAPAQTLLRHRLKDGVHRPSFRRRRGEDRLQQQTAEEFRARRRVLSSEVHHSERGGATAPDTRHPAANLARFATRRTRSSSRSPRVPPPRVLSPRPIPAPSRGSGPTRTAVTSGGVAWASVRTASTRASRNRGCTRVPAGNTPGARAAPRGLAYPPEADGAASPARPRNPPRP